MQLSTVRQSTVASQAIVMARLSHSQPADWKSAALPHVLRLACLPLTEQAGARGRHKIDPAPHYPRPHTGGVSRAHGPSPLPQTGVSFFSCFPLQGQAENFSGSIWGRGRGRARRPVCP